MSCVEWHGFYRATYAQQCYRQRLTEKGFERQCWHLAFEEVAIPLLKEGWSPEQIRGFYRHSEFSVSHEWLYQRILRDKQNGGTAYLHLRGQKQRKKRYGKPERCRQITHRRSIAEWLAEVETRERIGNWEADTIIGAKHQGAIVSLIERKSGYTRLIRVPNKEAAGVTQAIGRALRPFQDQVLTITGLSVSRISRILKALQESAEV